MKESEFNEHFSKVKEILMTDANWEENFHYEKYKQGNIIVFANFEDIIIADVNSIGGFSGDNSILLSGIYFADGFVYEQDNQLNTKTKRIANEIFFEKYLLMRDTLKEKVQFMLQNQELLEIEGWHRSGYKFFKLTISEDNRKKTEIFHEQDSTELYIFSYKDGGLHIELEPEKMNFFGPRHGNLKEFWLPNDLENYQLVP